MRHNRTSLVAATVLGLALTAACTGAASPSAEDGPARAVTTSAQRAGLPDHQVVVISLDGLNPTALSRLGRTGAPALHRMMRQGASTLNARAEVEQTETLPNHTGMVTGRRIEKARDGHAVTWNDERLNPFTVQEAAEHGVDSIFSLAKRQGLSSALYSAKEKFSLFDRSWPDGTDKVLIDSDNTRLADVAVRDLQRASYDFAFLHISLPDRAGHAYGWLSAPYLDAVRQSDALVGQVLEAVRADSRLSDRVTVMLTADHGGPRGKRNHAEAGILANYRVPFLMWGAGVTRGADLYELSPQLADPGTRRVGYGARRQPVRNAFVANAAAEILGLPTVRGSRLGAAGELNWR
ncbi:sulfatase-like hydrolase/transferase [Nocardioides sp. HDW12B]|uniref:alkaline phosphatase family protein n=1 Tax=Nocardioides sp. HDW12B TaxID=2714939 RepID=UPI00140D05A9|nr:alkaline phosphatase family protein [Nocardioides sp. HDW12B]QIK68256.1 sulfatase-like hydrolase/transferase [Nocardioides sp. HDW12B]